MTGVPYVAVVGAGEADELQHDHARRLGRALAQAGAIVVCGGLGGVMEAACQGASEAGGLTLGILPGTDRAAANPYVDVAIPTGLGELRNGLVVRTADAVVAVGGAFGTLSEIALAIKTGVPVVGLGTWDLARPGIRPASSPEDAAARALALVDGPAGR